MIRTQNLAIGFQDGTGINYKDLTFNDGETYVLLGASGCGKSTLLNMMAGVLTPAHGEIFIDDRDMAKLSQHQRDKFRIVNIGYIFQDFKLIEEMTVEDNIRVLELEGVNVSAMDSLLEKLHISKLKKRRISRLSGGEKQRVAIARALVKSPSIILADEPTGNLNYAIGREVVEELVSASKGHTLICVTHDDRLAEMFDHIIDMNTIAMAKEARHNA